MLENPRFVVGWDIDGVQARSEVPVLAAVNRELGTNFTPADLSHWNFLQEQVSARIKDPAKAALIADYWYDPGLLLQAPPFRGRLAVMNICRFTGIDNQVITTRRPHTRQSTLDWYKRHLPWVVSENRLHVRTDDTENGDQFKINTARRLCLGRMVEDSGSTVTAFDNAGLLHLVSFISQPWNASFTQYNHLRIKNDLQLLSQIMRDYLLFTFSRNLSSFS